MKVRRLLIPMFLFVFSWVMMLPNNIVKADSTGQSTAVLQSGDYIYYVNQTNKNLCSIKKDGTEIKILSKDKVNGNIVIKGNYIYYGTQDNKIVKNKFYNQIYKIKKDGTGKTKLADLEAYSTYIDCIDGDYIYFTKTSLKSGDTRLHRVTTSGTKLSQLTNGAYDVSIADKKIYYHVLYGGGPNIGNLFSMNLDGTNKKLLRKNVTKFIISGSEIFYTSAESPEEDVYLQYLNKMNVDNTKNEVIAKIGEARICEITKAVTCYTSNSKLYQMDNKTGHITELATLAGDFSYGGFMIKSNRVYYVDATATKSVLYCVSLDGKEKATIYELNGDIAYIEVVDSKIFFVERSYESNKITQCYYDRTTEQLTQLDE